MNKLQALELIKLLSALESWTFATKERLPDYLFERLDNQIIQLTEQVLND